MLDSEDKAGALTQREALDAGFFDSVLGKQGNDAVQFASVMVSDQLSDDQSRQK